MVLALVAGALRFSSLDFGRGVLLARPDELGVLATLRFLREGVAAPPFLLYGGGYFLPLALVVAGAERLVWRRSLAEIIAQDPFSAILVARGFSAILSMLTVLLTFLAGRRMGGRRCGYVAAALLAVLPLAVREAHFAKADSAAAFVAALLLLLLVSPGPRSPWRLVALGAIGALATSTKACVGFLPAVVISAASTRDWKTLAPWRSLGLGGLAFALSWLLLNSPAILSPGTLTAIPNLFYRSFSDVSWLPGSDLVSSPFLYHWELSLRYGCGLAFTVLCGPAIVLALLRSELDRHVAIAVIGYWVTLLLSPMVLARFLLPAIPGLCLLIARLLVWVADALVARAWLRTFLLSLFTAVVIARPMVESYFLVDRLGRVDTRHLAAGWIMENLPADSKIAVWGAPRPAVNFGAPDLGARSSFVNLPPGRWASAGITHVVRHSYPLPYSSGALPGAAPAMRRIAVFDPVREPSRDLVLEPLDAFYLPLWDADAVDRPGPRIEIYEIERRPG